MLLRSTLPVFVLAFFGGIFLLRELGLDDLYGSVLYGLGIIPAEPLFIDAHAIAAAAQCHRQGIDVMASNPCDVLGRSLKYSPFWLTLVPSFVTTDHTFVLGLLFNLSFVAALFVVLRPESWREWTVLAAACVSTDVTFAVERGNTDLFLFALAALGVVLLGSGATARFVAYAGFLLGGLLKYYPLVLLATSLREAPARVARLALAAGIGLCAFVVVYRAELARVAGHMTAKPFFTDLFGARNLPFGLAELHVHGPAGLRLAVAIAGLVLMTAACLAVAWSIARRFGARRIAIDWESHDARSLLVGSLLVVGCFFAVQSIGYRGIHLLFGLSGLVALLRTIADFALRRILIVTIAAIVAVMWGEGLRHAFELLLRQLGLRSRIPGLPSEIFWILRELVWWWVIAVLTAMIGMFAVHTPLARSLQMWTSRKFATDRATLSSPDDLTLDRRHHGS